MSVWRVDGAWGWPPKRDEMDHDEPEEARSPLAMARLPAGDAAQVLYSSSRRWASTLLYSAATSLSA